MKAMPVAVRERIIHFYAQGQSTQEIAAMLDYCVAAVRRVRQNFKRRGTLAPQAHQCGRKTLLTPARQVRPSRAGQTARRHAEGTGGQIQTSHLHHGPLAGAPEVQL